MLDINNISARDNKYPAYWKLWKVRAAEQVSINKLIEQNTGQGEGDTKWKGCPWKALRLKFNIVNDKDKDILWKHCTFLKTNHYSFLLMEYNRWWDI
jgi:hypothetical protein